MHAQGIVNVSPIYLLFDGCKDYLAVYAVELPYCVNDFFSVFSFFFFEEWPQAFFVKAMIEPCYEVAFVVA